MGKYVGVWNVGGWVSGCVERGRMGKYVGVWNVGGWVSMWVCGCLAHAWVSARVGLRVSVRGVSLSQVQGEYTLHRYIVCYTFVSCSLASYNTNRLVSALTHITLTG